MSSPKRLKMEDINDEEIDLPMRSSTELAADRERRDKISKMMGDHLLKGYKMLDRTCDACDCILLQAPRNGPVSPPAFTSRSISAVPSFKFAPILWLFCSCFVSLATKSTKSRSRFPTIRNRQQRNAKSPVVYQNRMVYLVSSIQSRCVNRSMKCGEPDEETKVHLSACNRTFRTSCRFEVCRYYCFS